MTNENQIRYRQYGNQLQPSGPNGIVYTGNQPGYCIQPYQFYLISYLDHPRYFTSLTTTNIPHEAEDFKLLILVVINAYY